MPAMGEHFRFHVLVLMMHLRKKFSMRKATKSNDVPVKKLKQNADFFYDYIQNSFNFCVMKLNFPISFNKLT